MYVPPKVETPDKKSEVMLHACCAPCSSAILECLLHNGIKPVVFYYNPNIYPREEYEIRKAESIKQTQNLGIRFIDGDYDHEAWKGIACGLENEPERGSRCLECFKMRLLATAQCARKEGISIISTTLASSRWKSLQQWSQQFHFDEDIPANSVILLYIPNIIAVYNICTAIQLPHQLIFL